MKQKNGTENIITVIPSCTGYYMCIWSLLQTVSKSSKGDWDNHYGVTLRES